MCVCECVSVCVCVCGERGGKWERVRVRERGGKSGLGI